MPQYIIKTKMTIKTCCSNEGQIENEKYMRSMYEYQHMVKVLFPVLCTCHNKLREKTKTTRKGVLLISRSNGQ